MITKKQVLSILAAIFLIAALGFGVDINPEDKAAITGVVTELSDNFMQE